MQQGLIVLITKPNDSVLYGPVECSFSLDVQPNQTFLYWSSEEYKLDAVKWSQRDIKMWRESHPDWTFQVYDANDPLLPIVIDWAGYEDARSPGDTLSGVKNKYRARNLFFHRKNNHELARDLEAQ